ncbi:Fic family protein [Liquorilactobacillus vini DSM 20605]|uniref:Fic family protein n=2 Tax=Liquorilactobacillus vini TaxID=238015 RepID=A0A0R2CD38_9LACO|nr:Fic family protein [Liquorilactobacillus vini DSM 20605]
MMILKKFDYKNLNSLEITASMNDKLNQIYEFKGRLSATSIFYKEALDHLVNVAKVQSTDASNRIEGIYTSNTRLKQLVQQETRPRNRSEAEIAGYRDVLALIHEQYAYIPINSSSILTLHKRLFSYTNGTWGGQFKDSDNQIITKYADGRQEVRLQPPAAYLTPKLVRKLCINYNLAVDQQTFSPLILLGALIFDFVSIHPFRDGNGRMSRLLMLLTMYQAQFNVGKYISLEKLIEKTKQSYYEVLKQSSSNWQNNQNNYAPFLDYFLGIVLQAYRNLNDRINLVQGKPVSAADLILKTLTQELKPLSRSELAALIPQYSEITIKRALSELKKSQRIKLIGKGRSSKYILKN